MAAAILDGTIIRDFGGGSSDGPTAIPNLDGPSDAAESLGEHAGAREHVAAPEHGSSGEHGDVGHTEQIVVQGGANGDHEHEAAVTPSSETLLPIVEEQPGSGPGLADECSHSVRDTSEDRGESPHRLRAFWHSTKESFQHASDRIAER